MISLHKSYVAELGKPPTQTNHDRIKILVMEILQLIMQASVNPIVFFFRKYVTFRSKF